MLQIYNLKTEYLASPNAVDNPHPRFSWKLKSDRMGVYQDSYHIIARDADTETVIWDSGVVKSQESRFVHYRGTQLRSRQKIKWMVEVTTIDETNYSESVSGPYIHFQMGLLRREDWHASWIEAEGKIKPRQRKPAVYLRRTFHVETGLKEARVYQTAHGLYEATFNGKVCTEDKFKPGLTSYYHRIQYQTYDVTNLLTEGENLWSVVLADGWWRGVTGGTVANNFGYKLHYFGQLELFYEDGRQIIIGTDENFLGGEGPLRASDMLMGDVYDAGFEFHNWKPVHVVQEHADADLIASRSVPVREKEHFEAKELRDIEGNRVLDFGQNIAGYVRMKLRNCKPGQVVRLVHGEALDPTGAFSIQNIEAVLYPVDAIQEIRYVCKGDPEETYTPDFSVFGFRYVLLEGYDEPILPGDFTAIAVYSDMEETGSFSCSHDGINQLVRNSLWSQKGNFLDVAVDCPTRERNAWTGDAQIYVRTATNFMNVYPFFEKWLYDQKLEQYASGKVGITFPSTSSVHNPKSLRAAKWTSTSTALAGPTGNGHIGEDSCGWGDSAVWLPYIIYLCYGDKTILEQQYETSRKWVEFMLTNAKNKNPRHASKPWYQNGDDGDYIWDTNYHYGEWNEAFPPETYKKLKFRKIKKKKHNPAKSLLQAAVVTAFVKSIEKNGRPKVATAYMRRSTANLAQMAKVLGKTEDQHHYEALSRKIAQIYDQYFIDDDGVIEKGQQAPYVQALVMDLCSDKKRPMVAEQLVKEIKENEMCLNTGFLSTPFLLPMLADHGHADVAFALLEQTKCPSWLHPIELGATTILESWGALDAFESSFNHYSYGAVCEFLFGHVGGIKPIWEKPGYQEFQICPVVGGSLTHARAEYESPFGKIVSAWQLDDGKISYSFEIPVNTTAHVTLPDGRTAHLSSGTYHM